MKKKKSAAKKKQARRKKPEQQQTYRDPQTAAELHINCSVCGKLATWFDRERVLDVAGDATGNSYTRERHAQGFICDDEPRSSHAKKLLVRERAETSAPANKVVAA
jgi:hypothetical protein